MGRSSQINVSVFLCFNVYNYTCVFELVKKNLQINCRFSPNQVYNVLYTFPKVIVMTILIILILLVLLTIGGSWYAYSRAFYSPKSKRVSSDAPLIGEQYATVADNIHRISSIMQRFPFESVKINAEDGTVLFGRYYHFRNNAPIEILFHGYRSHPYRDCSGGHALARKMGFNVLVVDQRAHGSSGGSSITFGIKERLDCFSWIQYLNHRFGEDTPIILSGLSMGAATVLMTADLNLPQNVRCIIADSPYSSPLDIILKVSKDEGFPPAVCAPFLHLGARLFGRFQLGSCTAKDAVRNAKVPILLIHGEDDHFVPCEMSIEIAANCASRVEVATFPSAGHGLSYLTDPVRYEKVVCRFLCSIPVLNHAIDPDYICNLYENYPE